MSPNFIVIVVAVSWLTITLIQCTEEENISGKDSGPSTLDIIAGRGFIAELYEHKSLDGHTRLSLYRIVNPFANAATLNKYPVLVNHGFMGDSAMMISHSEGVTARKPTVGVPNFDQSDTNLPFALSNNNFDVWILDSRGTNMQNHDAHDDLMSMNSWNFTLDDQALLDVPAHIDFVLKQTQSSDKIIYVGFSESTFYMFALLSTHPEFESKLLAFVALSPVAYVAHLKGLIVGQLMPYLLLPDNINYDHMPQTAIDAAGIGIRAFCSTKMMNKLICGRVMDAYTGEGSVDDQPEFLTNLMKSESTLTIKHFAQLYNSKRFAMYDYGVKENIERYGQPTSPDYPLGRIKLPRIIMVRGGKDYMSTPEDQTLLLQQLGVRPYLDLFYPDFNHYSTLEGVQITDQVNIPIVRTLYELMIQVSHPLPFLKQPFVQPQTFGFDPKPPKKRVHPGLSMPGGLMTGRLHVMNNLIESWNFGLLKKVPWFGQVMTEGVKPMRSMLHMVGDNVDSLGTSAFALPGFVMTQIGI